MIRKTGWQEFMRRIGALFVPDVRLQVRPAPIDRRSQAQRDRDIESEWRRRVRMNEQRRALARRAPVTVDADTGKVTDTPRVDLRSRQAI